MLKGARQVLAASAPATLASAGRAAVPAGCTELSVAHAENTDAVVLHDAFPTLTLDVCRQQAKAEMVSGAWVFFLLLHCTALHCAAGLPPPAPSPAAPPSSWLQAKLQMRLQALQADPDYQQAVKERDEYMVRATTVLFSEAPAAHCFLCPASFVSACL